MWREPTSFGRERESAALAAIPERSAWRVVAAELRPHQWTKNGLLLVPMLLAPDLPTFPRVLRGITAAMTFSLSASAGYVLNDIVDVEADRAHPTKRHRPFASGALPIAWGVPVVLALAATSFGLALVSLPLRFVVMLATYFVGTLAYSLYLKRRLLVDVLALAGLYTHRIVSGGVATGTHASAWLLGFSMFLFTSLAFVKRYVELGGATDGEKIRARSYSRADVQMVTSMGTASAFVAALVFMLYVESQAVRAIYREPGVLWLILPVLLYWLGRIWLLAGRGQMHDDPVRFATKDARSIACAVAIVAIVVVARFVPPQVASIFRGG